MRPGPNRRDLEIQETEAENELLHTRPPCPNWRELSHELPRHESWV